MCSTTVSRHSTPHATTVFGNTFKKFLPNRQRLHPWSREGGGGVLKVRPSPVRYVGSSSRRLTQGRVGEGSPLWQTLFLPRLTWKACRVEREGPGMYERNPGQPNPRLTYSACRAGGGRSVCWVRGTVSAKMWLVRKATRHRKPLLPHEWNVRVVGFASSRRSVLVRKALRAGRSRPFRG